MKKIVKAVVIGLLTISLTGCGTIIAMRGDAAQFDLQTIEAKQNLDSSPVKSNVFHNVTTVTVADYSDYLEGYPEDNIRAYKTIIKQVEKRLKNSGKYKVVSSKNFQKAIKREGFDLDISIDSAQEVESVLAKVGKSMGVHGVITIDLEQDDNVSSMGNQISYMKQLVIDGEIRLEMELKVTMLRAKTGEVLYSQANMVNWITGTSGLGNTKQIRLDKVVSSATDPLVDGMIGKI
tara:strand:- start:2051 stop:2755 length:705 start_codon:yes stop_codon:yes gene_type:complete